MGKSGLKEMDEIERLNSQMINTKMILTANANTSFRVRD